MYQDLRDILCAWVVSRSDEGLGYVRIVLLLLNLVSLLPSSKYPTWAKPDTDNCMPRSEGPRI